jgi:hypothetical protein
MSVRVVSRLLEFAERERAQEAEHGDEAGDVVRLLEGLWDHGIDEHGEHGARRDRRHDGDDRRIDAAEGDEPQHRGAA